MCKTYEFCHCIEIKRSYILDIILHQYSAWQTYFPSKIGEGRGLIHPPHMMSL